jgi:hypothetical protein
MVIEYIDKNPPVMAVGIVDAVLALQKKNIACGKRIDLAVHFQTPPDSPRIAIVEPPFDEIAHHVPYERFLVSSEKKMYKIVHGQRPKEKIKKTTRYQQ